MASPLYDEIVDSGRVIRVLTLSQGREEDPLHGELETCRLDMASAYDALSYCWGPKELESVIDCGRGSVRITKTLDRALRVLRHKNESRRLWIDQICINQTDDPERSHQVRLMYDIYSLAQRTIVWLGDDEKQCGPLLRKLLNHLEAVGAVYRSHEYNIITPPDTMSLSDSIDLLAQQVDETEEDSQMTVNNETTWFPTDDLLGQCRLPTRSSEAWSAFNSILQAVYFTRVWTLQEVLSSKEATIFWGTTELSWASLRGAYHWAKLNHCMVKDPRRGSSSPDLPRVKFLELELSWFRGIRFQTLADLVIVCREGFEATDPRDQIYAFTSLASDGVNFEIDYTKNEAQVFTAFSECYLRSGDLTMLNLAGLYGAEGPNLPSWVANWSSRRRSLQIAGRDIFSWTNLERPVFPLAGGGPGTSGSSLQDRRSDDLSALDTSIVELKAEEPDKVFLKVKGFRLDQAEAVCTRSAYSSQGPQCVSVVAQCNELFRACGPTSTSLRAIVHCMASAERASDPGSNELLAQLISFMFDSIGTGFEEYVDSLGQSVPDESSSRKPRAKT